MSLVTRAINMLKSPKTEWDAVAAEEASVGSLFTGYAVPLSLVSSLAGFIGSAFLASAVTSAFGLHYGMTYYLGTAVVGWILGLVGLYVWALIVNFLAPKFASTANSTNAMKLVVYAMTGSWVGGIAQVIPVLGGIVAIVGGIYSIYLFYLGVPKLMGTPQDKVVVYMIVSAIAMFLIMMVIGMIVTGIAAAMFAPSILKIGY
jgi:hypothetical protein